MSITCFRCLRGFQASPELLEKGRRGRYIVYQVLNRVTCPNCGNPFHELLEEVKDREPGAILCENWPVKARDYVRR